MAPPLISNGHLESQATSNSSSNAYQCTFRLVIVSIVTGQVLLVLPFTVVEIILGAQFWNSCPIERLLPIYLMFSGCLGLLLCALCAANFMLVFGYCQTQCCIECKETRVSLTVCLAIVNCMWLACGFAFTIRAVSLHSTWDTSGQTSTLPTDSYLYCDSNLLAFSKAAVFVRLWFLASIIALKRLMYFDLANLMQKRPIALGSRK